MFRDGKDESDSLDLLEVLRSREKNFEKKDLMISIKFRVPALRTSCEVCKACAPFSYVVVNLKSSNYSTKVSGDAYHQKRCLLLHTDYKQVKIYGE